MRIRTQMLTAMLAAAACAALSMPVFADVTGKVTLDGKAPEPKQIDMSGVKECNDQHPDPVNEETVVAGDKGELKNVIVSIKKEDSPDLAGEVPKTPVILDQKACQYTPHVLPMMAGQEFLIKNDDPFLHNVHSLAQTNPTFNFGQPNKDEGKKVDPMKAAEYFRVKCDVHPWMSAYIAVFDHPYFATTGDDGSYTIKGLPDGDYTLTAWHEKFGTQEQKITVKGGKTEKPADFSFKAEAAMAPDVKNVILASDSGDAKTEQCQSKTGECCAAMKKATEEVAAKK